MRISQAIIEFEEELRKDKCLRKMIEKLKEDLTKRGKKKYFITIDPNFFLLIWVEGGYERSTYSEDCARTGSHT